jgi:hypothetical protein
VTLAAAGPVAEHGAKAALVAALGLAVVHAFAGAVLRRLQELSERSRERLLSASAGASVAYVFVDVLPELAAQREVVVQGSADASALLFAEQRVYILALFSFVVFYGLEYVLLVERKRGEESETSRLESRYFPLHLLAFSAYTMLIGRLLVERTEHGFVALALYSLAMGVHFVIVAHTLNERFPRRYARWGRWMLAASVVVGWAVAATSQMSDVTFARLFAILAGGVVITSVHGELLGEHRGGRFGAFVLGALIFAAVLVAA